MPIIKNCGEPLVDVKKACPGIIIRLDKKRMKKEKTAYLRKTVAKMLCDAKSYLPKGMNFVLRDAWRPQYVQKEIFENFLKIAKKRFPKVPEKKIIEEVKKYVAPYEGKNISGHLTGGAMDIRIIKNGRLLPMRSKKLSYQENSLSRHPKLPKHLQKNRKIMANALEKAGLSNYPLEFWHWSYGDLWWAKRQKKEIAIYGLINPGI